MDLPPRLDQWLRENPGSCGSGCGKTVLLNHILGQLTLDSGRVLVANHDEPVAPIRDVVNRDFQGSGA